jgi:thiolase-like protein
LHKLPADLGRWGVWQTGRPPAVDNQGNVYYFVGNGWPTGRNDARHKPPCDYSGPGILSKPAGYYGQSLIKLDPANSLRLVGSWSPTNWCALDNTDNDLGGSGPALIDAAINGARRTLAVGGGKAGALYVIDIGLTSSPDIVAGCAGDQQPPAGQARRAGRPGIPLNTNGGCLSYMHSGMYGMYALQESVRQMRGTAPAQIPDAKISVCHGVGGMFAASGTIIMSNGAA